jgi:hypothetical protein
MRARLTQSIDGLATRSTQQLPLGSRAVSYNSSLGAPGDMISCTDPFTRQANDFLIKRDARRMAALVSERDLVRSLLEVVVGLEVPDEKSDIVLCTNMCGSLGLRCGSIYADKGAQATPRTDVAASDLRQDRSELRYDSRIGCFKLARHNWLRVTSARGAPNAPELTSRRIQ